MTYNTRNPAVKRLMKEAQELSESTELFYAKPLEDNLFEWHFTIRGPCETDFDGGIYHGRILLPAEYPMKPPNILLMTPSGRFEVNRKICLSISGYHPETWRPSWSIRTALLAIIGFMPTHGVGAIGSLEYPPEERRKLAKNSVDFVCSQCGGVKDILKSLTEASVKDVKEAMDLATQIVFTGDKDNEVEKTTVVEKTEVKEVECASTPPPLPPAVATQPLSFEEWCRQMKPVSGAIGQKNKGDNDAATSVVTDTAAADTAVADTAVADDNNNINVVKEEVIEVAQVPLSVVDSSSPNVLGRDTVHHVAPAPLPAVLPLPAATAGSASNIDILIRRQTTLLQCMAVVGGLLGLFLAVRLGSLGIAED